MRAYGPTVSIRRLFAILVAVAVLFGPVFTHASAASAAVGGHHSQMVDAGNCESPTPVSSQDDTTPTKSCCVSMCMGVAAMPAPRASSSMVRPVPAVAAIPTLHLSYLGEIATPPPRRS